MWYIKQYKEKSEEFSMASKLFQGYSTYEEMLAAMANAYGDLKFSEETIAKNPGEVIQTATDEAKGRLRGNRRKTALIMAGLVVGTVLTGGALGTAVLGAAGLAAGVGVLGVSGAALGTKWKMVYNTLNPRGSRDTTVLMDRFLVKEDRWNRHLATLEEKMNNAKNAERRNAIKKRYERKMAAHQKFLNNYTRSSVFNKVRMDCKGLAQERPGIMGKFDKLQARFREGAYTHLGIEYFDKKYELALEQSEQLLDLMEKAQEAHESRAVDNGVKVDPNKRVNLDKMRQDSEYWFRLAKGSAAEVTDWEASTVEKQQMEQYLNNFPKEVQKALETNLKGKNLNLGEIKASINGALNNNQAFNQYSLQTIDYALKNCDIDLVTLNTGKGNASINKDAVDVVNYIVQNDMVKDLSKEAKTKLFAALDQSNNICDKELQETIKKDFYDFHHASNEDGKKASTNGYNNLVDGLYNYRHEQQFNRERRKLEKDAHAKLCENMGLSVSGIGGYDKWTDEDKKKADELYDKFVPLFDEMKKYVENPKQDKNGNLFIEMPLDKIKDIARTCIDTHSSTQRNAEKFLLSAFGVDGGSSEPNVVNSFIKLNSNGTLKANLDGSSVVHGEKKQVIKFPVVQRNNNAQQTVNRGNSFDFGDRK